MRAIADTTALGPIAFDRAWANFSGHDPRAPSRSTRMLIDGPIAIRSAIPPVGETDPVLLELRRRSAIEAVIGHMKAEGRLGPLLSQTSRRRCRPRHPLWYVDLGNHAA